MAQGGAGHDGKRHGAARAGGQRMQPRGGRHEIRCRNAHAGQEHARRNAGVAEVQHRDQRFRQRR
jgi:hypothetical protein